MRIAYLVPEFPGQTHAFFWREIAALRAQGHELTLVSTRDSGPEACRHAFAAAARAETAYLYPPPLPRAAASLVRPAALHAAWRQTVAAPAPLRRRLRLAGLMLCAAELARIVRAKGIAHIHAHSCADSAHIAAAAAGMAKIGYSLTLHGDLPVYGGEHKAKMARAAFVSAVTRPLREQVIAETGFRPSRVPVITMGVDTDRFAPPPTRRGEGPLRLLTVARLNHTKGHRFALEAIAAARRKGWEMRYAIAGEGPEREAIEGHVAALGLGAAVTLLGSRGEAEVRALLRESDAFLLTSFGLGEAAPVSVMEAMACGLPVICSRIGGTADMIDDGLSGLLVDQQDVPGITEALVLLAASAELREEIGAAARAQAVAQFDYRVTAAALGRAIELFSAARAPAPASLRAPQAMPARRRRPPRS